MRATLTGTLAGVATRGHRQCALIGVVCLVTMLVSNIQTSPAIAADAAAAAAVGAWTEGNSMASARAGHTATLLDGPGCHSGSPPGYCGKVLVAGGFVDDKGLVSSELYDPASGTWSSTGPMRVPRFFHTATLLPNGRVLAVGGRTTSATPERGAPSPLLNSAEIYDPAAGAWSLVGSMHDARSAHTATLLGGSTCANKPAPAYCGMVLVLGGQPESAGVAQSAELYDPATGSWSATPTAIPIPARNLQNPAATLLGGVACKGPVSAGYCGKVLVSTDVLTELYDPATGTWSAAAPMTHRRLGYSATDLPDGKVLAAGGHGPDDPQTAEVYDPVAGAWSVVGHLNRVHVHHQAILFGGSFCDVGSPPAQCGKVLVVGGTGGENSAELYDPVTTLWTDTSAPAWPSSEQTATLLLDGGVLMTGGLSATGDASAQSYSSSRAEVPAQPKRGNASNAVQVWVPFNSTGPPVLSRLYPDRGVGGRSILITGSRLDKVTGVRFGALKAASFQVSSPTAVVAVSPPESAGTVPVTLANADGVSASKNTGRFTYVDHDAWGETGGLSVTRSGHTATLLTGAACASKSPARYCGEVLVAGGDGTGSAELYDPRSGTWARTGSMSTPRSHHTATLLPTGKVMVAGGLDPITETASVELYDPASGHWNAAPPMRAARYSHTATMLDGTACQSPAPPPACGKVLVTGGASHSDYVLPIAASELFDPVTSTWSEAAQLSDGRAEHTATLLPTGDTLVIGGLGTSGKLGSDVILGSAELYQLRSGTWAQIPRVAVARFSHTATLLNTGSCGRDCGKVLVVGGTTFEHGQTFSVSSAELFDPVRNSWSRVADLPASRTGHTATALPDGNILVVGGGANPGDGERLSLATELYEPTLRRWDATDPLTTSREGHTATLLDGGCHPAAPMGSCAAVLVAGGYPHDTLRPPNSEEVFREVGLGAANPASSTLSRMTLVASALLGLGALLLYAIWRHAARRTTGETKTVKSE